MNPPTSSGGLYQSLGSRAGMVASEWYESAVSWFGEWFAPSRIVQDKPEPVRVAESLISELVQQGRILEERRKQLEKKAMAASGTADYR